MKLKMGIVMDDDPATAIGLKRLRAKHRAAELGNAIAQYDLGVLHDSGQGVPQEFARAQKAMKWYDWAVMLGRSMVYPDEMTVYYHMKYSMVQQDDAESLKWYRMAAKQAHAAAQNNLGNMYMNGRGVPQNYVQAHTWFSLAAAGGAAEAATNLDIVTELMTPVQIAEAKRLAQEWLAAHPKK